MWNFHEKNITETSFIWRLIIRLSFPWNQWKYLRKIHLIFSFIRQPNKFLFKIVLARGLSFCSFVFGCNNPTYYPSYFEQGSLTFTFCLLVLTSPLISSVTSWFFLYLLFCFLFSFCLFVCFCWCFFCFCFC